MEVANNQPAPVLNTSILADVINEIQGNWQHCNNNNLFPPDSQLSPEIQQWIKNTVPTLISLAKTDENFNFPVNEGFSDLIKRFLQLPTIRTELISAYPYFIALLRFPAIDASFYRRMFDPDYLRINWDPTEFVVKRNFIIPAGGRFRNRVKWMSRVNSSRIGPPASTGQPQNDMFIQIMHSTNVNGIRNDRNMPNAPPGPGPGPIPPVATANGAQNIQNVSNLLNDTSHGSLVRLPVSIQLFSEGVPAHSRLTKFFYPDALPDDLTIDSFDQEMSVDEFKLCFASSCKYYRWGVRRTPTYVYLHCKMGRINFASEFNNQDSGCPAQIKLKVENNRIKMTYSFHHNHSFFKYEKDYTPIIKKDPVRAWLIEQALQGKDWAWVNANKEGVNIAGDVVNIDLSKKINRHLYFQIRRILGVETSDQPDESEEDVEEPVSPSTNRNNQHEGNYLFNDETHGSHQNNSYDFPSNDYHGVSESPPDFDIPNFDQSEDNNHEAETEANNRVVLKAECEEILKYVQTTMENAFEVLHIERLHDLKGFIKRTAQEMQQEFLPNHST